MAGIKDCYILGFTIPEDAPWREEAEQNTSEKIQWIKEQCQLISQNKFEQPFLDWFKEEMEDEFVCESNVASSVGTQTLATTKNTRIKRDSNTREEKETENTYNGLSELSELQGCELNLETIKGIHKTLMEGLEDSIGGKLRGESDFSYETYCRRPDGKKHNYPDQTLVKLMLKGILKQHNIHLDNVPDTIEDKVPFVIKSAAWLLAQFVTVHPFVDGNGRMCRLLASHVLSEIIPFPVHVYKTALVKKEEYVQAIIQCQDDNGDPLDLAALLVDSVFNGLEKMIEEKETWVAPKRYIVIPVKTNKIIEVLAAVCKVYNDVEKAQPKIAEICRNEITKSGMYKELYLTDPSDTVQYILRRFR